MRIRRRKNTWLIALGVFVAVFLFAFLTAKFKGDEDVDAADLGKFDPGYIISDYQMGNYNAMNEAEIQAFLTKKNPCNNTNYNYYLQLSSGSAATWHFANGHFVCLSEERFGDGETIGSGDTAAHIIWQTAQDYRINPQVLIVLLQKETGLITDPIPNNYDYRKATGYGCPDTAACSSKYYGFKNQVRNAAALFRTVLDGGWTNYPLGNNYIQYNPNSGCGGSWVNVRSLATSALYRYTPYQPNASALAAGYGTGDSCSAYGNRNFYSYFEDWFGGVTNEAKWVDMESPRYMISDEVGSYYDLMLNKSLDEPFGEERINYYSDKTFTVDGKMCLRTISDRERGTHRCVLYDDLREVDWRFTDMELPRYLEAGDGVAIIDPTTRENLRYANRYEYYDKKIFLPDGDMCLRAKGNSANECVLYSSLHEVEYEIYPMETPRYLVAGESGAVVVDAVSDTPIMSIKKNSKVFYSKKIILPDDSICLLVSDEKKYNCVRLTDLRETWVAMEKPREMRMLADSYKINAVTFEKSDDVFLPIGMRRKFLAKRYLKNGEWCLQTEYDYERKTDNCVLFGELGEI